MNELSRTTVMALGAPSAFREVRAAPARVEAVTVRNSRRVAMTTSGVSEKPEIWVDATICFEAEAVNSPGQLCCCNVKMSSPNCSVKRSSLNGDLHVEPEGTASAGAVEGAVWRAADECPGGRRPPDHCAAGPAAEAPVRGRGPRRARARQPRPSLAPAVARGGAGRGRAADDDRLRGLQRHAPDREAAGASRPGHLARDGAAVPRAAWPPSEARAPGAARPAPASAERRAGGLDPDRRQPLPLARGPRPRADAPRRHRRRHERDPRLTVPPGRGRPWLPHAVSRRVHGPWPAHGRVRRSPEPACPQ